MISIIIAEDQYMLRKAMVQLIEFNEQMKVVNDCNNGVTHLSLLKISSRYCNFRYRNARANRFRSII